MKNMLRAAQRPASDLVAATLRARVPSGSLSHLSGKRLAAPADSISDEARGVTVKKEERLSYTHSGLRPGACCNSYPSQYKY